MLPPVLATSTGSECSSRIRATAIRLILAMLKSRSALHGRNKGEVLEERKGQNLGEHIAFVSIHGDAEIARLRSEPYAMQEVRQSMHVGLTND